jgi:hypothetical protein
VRSERKWNDDNELRVLTNSSSVGILYLGAVNVRHTAHANENSL